MIQILWRATGMTCALLLQLGVAHADDGDNGARVFLVYCAGCHGFDGLASYPPAPSFAMGERLQQDDQKLLQSVLNGKGGMPPWQDKLPESMLRKAIAYLRNMAARSDNELAARIQALPEFWFRFRPVGSRDDYSWMAGDD